jgi:hypothetical protein
LEFCHGQAIAAVAIRIDRLPGLDGPDLLREAVEAVA